MDLPPSVEVVEVGPRDGLQNEALNVPTPEKVALIEALAAAGLRRLEATSFVSPKVIPQLADAEDVVAGLRAAAAGARDASGIVYGALIPNERGYERAKAAGVGEVVIVGTTTESYSRKNLNMSVDEALDAFAPIAERGRQDGVRVRANVSTVFGDPFEGPPDGGQVLRVVSRVVEAGIDNVTLSDTIGIANPRQVSDVFAAVLDAHPGVTFGAHFHDTRGLAAANTVAALGAGVSTFDASVGGLGGSPKAPGAGGNVATEDLVYMLAEMGVETGVDLEALMDAADLLERLVGHPLNTRIRRPLVAGPGAR